MATIPNLAPQPQQYPALHLQIIPQGLAVTIQLGPTTNLSQLIVAEDMDNVCKLWRDMRKNQGNGMDIIRAVQQTKNG